MTMLLGSIEAGGTKMVCAVGNTNYQIKDSIHIPTTTPEETLGKIIDYFKQFDNLSAIGIASFGPIEIRRSSPKYGYITDTPKPGWSNVDFVGPIKKALNVPIAWTTDVNGSAYGEYLMATCPFHGDCLEGLVAGPTFDARLGKPGKEVPLTDHVWDIMAYYVAQAALDTTLMYRPAQIVFGGGVISEDFLKKVRAEFKKLLNDYVEVGDLDKYITMPMAKNNGSATIGDFALALQAATE